MINLTNKIMPDFGHFLTIFLKKFINLGQHRYGNGWEGCGGEKDVGVGWMVAKNKTKKNKTKFNSGYDIYTYQ